MSREKRAGKDLGIFFGARDNGVFPEHSIKSLGAVDVQEVHFRKKAHRSVMSSLHSMFCEQGEENTKAARYIKALSTVEWGHDQHVEDASNCIFDTIQQSTSEFLKESSFKHFARDVEFSKEANMLSDSASGLLWLLGTFSALGGAGAGALTWKANKDIQEDLADNEAKKRKRDYYKKLTGDIKGKLNKNYNV